MSSEATSEYRRRRKLNLIQVCGNKCNICGYDKLTGALEFHHIDPTLKQYGIAENGTCHDIEVDLQEIKKCILVCANCHREIHQGLYTQEQLYMYQIYNMEIAQTLIKQRNAVLYGTPRYCKNCGRKISYGAELCSDCAAQERRIVKVRPDRETLKLLIQQFNFTELGKQFGVSDNAIRKWCKVENLPYRKCDIQKIKDWEKI